MMKTIDDVAVEGRRVLVRADLNVPLDGDRIADDGRIVASLPTLAALISRGAKVIVAAHLGRPGGRPDPKYSLAPVAARLAELLGQEVGFPGGIAGAPARAAVAALRPGGLVMLENLRFDEAETSKDDMARGHFAGQLAALRQLTADIWRPYVVVLGGAKVADKFDAFASLLGRADRILVGGAMTFPFLAARGLKTGTSLLVPGQIDMAARYLVHAAPGQIELPSDLIVATENSADAPRQVVAADAIPAEQMGLDIGPRSAARFAAAIGTAGTVFWNGPMGVYELAPFAAGTRAVARATADAGACTVVGGGDTGAAIRALGFPAGAFGHVSTGGGASLEFIQGKTLPGLAALEAR
jgi:phosphoglycerate kinase